MKPTVRCSVAVIALAMALAGQVQVAESASVGLDSLRAMLNAGKLAEADSLARVHLAELQKSGAADSTVARTIDVLVQSLWQRGQTGGQEDHRMAERAVKLKEKSFGSGHTEVASSVNNLAILFAVGGEYAAARTQFERALAIYEKRLGPDHPNVARVLMGLANVLGDIGDTPAALRAYERVLAINEKKDGPESDQVAFVLFNIGSTNFDSREYVAARQAFERAMAIWEKVHGADHPLVARGLNGLANVLSALGDPAAAQPLIERAVGIWEKAYGPENPYVAMGLNSLAAVLTARGDYVKVRALFERALAINEKSFGPEHPTVARVLNSFGAFEQIMGDYAAARPLYVRALAIREKEFGSEHVDVARTRMNLAGVLRGAGELDSARSLLERALATDEKLLGPENPDVALILENLGALLEDTGDYAAARRAHERSLAIREKALGVDHHMVATNLDHLTDILRTSGNFEAARASAARSLAVREKALGPDHPDLAESLSRLAWLEAAQGDGGHALEHALAAERITLDHLRLTSRGLSERQALQYASVRKTGLDVALNLAAAGLDAPSRRRSLDALVRSRAVVMDEMAARHRSAGDTAKPGVARAAADLASARTRLANLVVRGVGDDEPPIYRKLVANARDEAERAERAMAEVSATFVLEGSRSRIGIAEVTEHLPAGAALVAVAEFQRSDRSARGATLPGTTASYLAFVLRSGESDPTVVDLGAASRIDSLVGTWKRAASAGGQSTGGRGSSESAYREVGSALRVAVWDPVASAMGGARLAFVVPDGSLNLVSFAALPVEGGGYLVERDPMFHYLSAERDLVQLSPPARSEGLLALGGPDFDAASPSARSESQRRPRGRVASTTPPSATAYRGPRSSCGALAGMRFEPLGATGEETREIAQLWKRRAGGSSGSGDVLDLRGGAANEAALKQAAPGRRVLHLATHGFFLGGECGSVPGPGRGMGSLAEVPAPRDSSPTAPILSESPLLRSGLVLAGANHRSDAGANDDDGILTAEEIASLALSGVEWAVLSACETGVGDIRAGEGVFGLRRAFQVAGVGTLIMSLWSVDDEATRSWMRALYQGRLKDRLDTAAAVRHASLEILRERRAKKSSTHPFYWAAFVGAGDWR